MLFRSKKSFDVCLPLVVDSQCLALVFHEVHPREAGEVIYNDNPVSVHCLLLTTDLSSILSEQVILTKRPTSLQVVIKMKMVDDG